LRPSLSKCEEGMGAPAPFGRWPPPKKKVYLVKLSWEEAGWEAFLGAEGDAGP
jgi:hypothetical protein